MKKRDARERALVALYQMDVIQADPEEALVSRCQEDEETPSSLALAIVRGVKTHQKEIDNIISRFSREWDLQRFSNIDRNILRMAIYEIQYEGDIPFKVSVNEAVELAKIYSGDDAYKFVNGILAQVIKEAEKTTPAEDAAAE